MVELFRAIKTISAEKAAYRNGDNILTYGELVQQAEALAHSLKGSHTPVVLLGQKEPYMLVGMVACLLAGRPYVPIDASLPPNRIQAITVQLGSYTLFDGTALTPYRGETGDIALRGIAYIIFTSGTEGQPKGVPVKRKSLALFARWLLSQPIFESAKGQTVLNTARFSFDLSVADIYFSLYTGATLVGLDTDSFADADALARAVAACNPDLIICTPTFADYLLCSDYAARIEGVSAFFFCGEPLKPATCKRLFRTLGGVRLFNAYGPTEATCAVTGCEITQQHLTASALPCGSAENATCKIRILQEEIFLAGDAVTDGYLGSDEPITNYPTGDRGLFENGCLFCLGRKSGYLKFKGYRISLGEIECALQKHSAVKQCSVEPVYRGNTVVALACTVVSDSLTAEEVRTFLLTELPPYMVPATVTVTAEMRFNRNFKGV